MLDVRISLAKTRFFNAAILHPTKRAVARALAKAGAMVRREAQRSIRIREGASPPGRPPHGHTTAVRRRRSKSTGRVRVQRISPLREYIFFVRDGEQRVLIGPALLSDKRRGSLRALEYGGQSRMPQVIRQPSWMVRLLPREARRRLVTITIRARPFMRPALASVMPRIAGLLAGQIKV